MNQTSYVANAFVSCSLRLEDQPFVDYVCSILKSHRINPFGTVGKFCVAPENPISSMKKNVPLADFVVICATPRYLQQDIVTGHISKGLSEMVHVETGMAIALGKPVVVFVQEGTHVGNALPNITQYIVLNGQKEDFQIKKPQIRSLLSNAYQVVQNIKSDEALKALGTVLLGGLAFYGAIKLIGD